VVRVRHGEGSPAAEKSERVADREAGAERPEETLKDAIDAFVAYPVAHMSEPIRLQRKTEYAVRMTTGDMCVRTDNPETERIYPIENWIENQYNIDQTKVYQRRIIVLEDWTEVPR
jgi:hypothetical protein